MPIQDILAREDQDARRASAAAAAGRSITGFGAQARIADDQRFADRDAVFGGEAPIVGRRVEPIEIPRLSQVAEALAQDPLFRVQREQTVERLPFGDREQTLAFRARPGYRNYWFNDRAGRIARARRAGYAHVLDPDTGEPVSRVTDVIDARGRSSYLMEIPLEWYQADMAKNAARLQRRLDDIRTGRAGPGADDNRYIPQQGIHIEHR